MLRADFLFKQEQASTVDAKQKIALEINTELPKLNKIKKDNFRQIHGYFEAAANTMRKQLL